MRTKLTYGLALVGVGTFVLGCGGDRPLPLEPTVASAARFASDTDPRTVWEFHSKLSDGMTDAKLTGDSRDVDGNYALVSRYQGRLCGVHAKIFVVGGTSSGSGDGVFDPDAERSKCPNGARYVQLDLGGGAARTGPFTNAKAIDQMLPGDTKLQPTMRWSVGLSGCDRLVFNDVRVTRTDGGVTAPRTWSVETTATHLAACEILAKGAYVLTGATYAVPYRVTITEVL